MPHPSLLSVWCPLGIIVYFSRNFLPMSYRREEDSFKMYCLYVLSNLHFHPFSWFVLTHASYWYSYFAWLETENPVLICWGCYSRISQTGELDSTDIYCLTFQGVGRVGVFLRPFLVAYRWPLSCWSSHSCPSVCMPLMSLLIGTSVVLG